LKKIGEKQLFLWFGKEECFCGSKKSF
jgi:hypothetical protein